MKKREADFDDVICVVKKPFTSVPTDLLRNPKISLRAKALLSILLSNKSGWKTSMDSLSRVVKETKRIIYNTLRELEEFGYVKRYYYRDIRTKSFRGSFWVYTNEPFYMCIEDVLKRLQEKNYELCDVHKSEAEETLPFDKKTDTIKNSEKVVEKIKGGPKFVETLQEEDSWKSLVLSWLEYKKERRQNYAGEKSVLLFLSKLKRISNYNPSTAKEIIEESMANNWSGVFPLSRSTITSKDFKVSPYSRMKFEDNGKDPFAKFDFEPDYIDGVRVKK